MVKYIKFVSSQNFMVKCKNLVFCTRKVEIYNLIYSVLLTGCKKTKIFRPLIYYNNIYA